MIVLANGDKVREAKLVMIGSSKTGKSSIVNRFMRDTFSTDLKTTVGSVFFSKTLQIEGTLVKLLIWDTSGEERYRAMVPMYFHDADAAVIVYDITSKVSFQEVDIWLKMLREKGKENIIISLAGNKLDLKGMRMIDETVGQNYARKNSIPIFKETSALSGDNINAIFTETANLLTKGGNPGVKSDFPQLNEENEKKCC